MTPGNLCTSLVVHDGTSDEYCVVRRLRTMVFALAACAPAACGGGGTAITQPPPAPPGGGNGTEPELTVMDNVPASTGDALTLVWRDEFDAGSLDPATWYLERGDGSRYGIPGWGNNELQWYLPESAELRDGNLTITVREESQGGYGYTSARLHTRDRVAFRYGRIEARIRLPGGQGIWPAFWMLPQDPAYGGWAASGEIDIMEAVNLGATGGRAVHGTLHHGGEWPDNVFSGNAWDVPGDPTADFHVYAVDWEPGEIRWYVDDVLYAMQNAWSSTAAPFPAPFDQPFYILLNVAVGGDWPGAPDASTAFPVTMEVDYVRVYEGEP